MLFCEFNRLNFGKILYIKEFCPAWFMEEEQ